MHSPIAYYSELLDEYGEGNPRSLGWNESATQLARFDALCAVGDMNNKSVLDVGTGFGDFFNFLRERYPRAHYRGVEINPLLANFARERNPEAIINVSDFASYTGDMSDYVVASGLLTLKIENHERIYRDFIRKMFDSAHIAIGFNVLNRDHHPDDETYVAYSIPEVEAFCRTITPKVVVHTNYLPHDATFLLYN